MWYENMALYFSESEPEYFFMICKNKLYLFKVFNFMISGIYIHELIIHY